MSVNDLPSPPTLLRYKNVIFSMQGYFHYLDRVVTEPVYWFENVKGSLQKRKFGIQLYLEEAIQTLKSLAPETLSLVDYYGQTLPLLRLSLVEKRFSPKEVCAAICNGEKGSDQFYEEFIEFLEYLSHNTGVKKEHMGINGGELLGSHTVDSDFDIVIYGFENSWKVANWVSEAQVSPNTSLKPFDPNDSKDWSWFFAKMLVCGYFNTQDASSLIRQYVESVANKIFPLKMKYKNRIISFFYILEDKYMTHNDSPKYQYLEDTEIECIVKDASFRLFRGGSIPFEFIKGNPDINVKPDKLVTFQSCHPAIIKGARIKVRGKLVAELDDQENILNTHMVHINPKKDYVVRIDSGVQ